MRILQVVHGFPPNDWAGTELVTFHLSHALRERGHEVTVVTRVYDGAMPEGTLHEETFDGLPVIRIVNNYTRGGTFRLLYDNPWFNHPFLQLLQRLQPDVVHFQHVQHLSVSMLRLTAALGYPTILSLHDFFFACHRIHLLDAQQQLCPGPERGQRCVACLQDIASAGEARQRFSDMERVLHAPDVVVTPSVFLADKMRAYFPFLAERLRAIPLGVKAISGGTQERVPKVPGAPLRILYVGVLAPHKGAHVLLEALQGLPREAVEVSLYGLEWSQWATYIEKLHETATELPVKFCGTYTHDQIGDILLQHDVLVMPMIWEETFSILVREAFLAGVPVIAARRGALVEAVENGINGLLFEPENAANLRRCIERILAEPALLAQFRDAVPVVKTVDEYAHEMEMIYADVYAQQYPPQENAHAVPSVSHVHPSLAFPSSATPTPSAIYPSDRAEEEEGSRSTERLPEVSVCIPTYNGAAFVAEAIQSVLSQTFRDFELLIVDDGSTDATVEIARSFIDPRIRINQNEKQLGIPGNWNRCLALARGEYICIFHQDDVMLPENLRQKVALLETNRDISFVHSAVEFVVENSTPPMSNNWLESATDNFTIGGRQYFRKLLLQGNLICAPTVVARRSCLCQVGGFDEELGYAPDYETWLKLCVKGRVAFISQPLLQYRWHENNASHRYRFVRGVNEVQLARSRALQYYEHTYDSREEQKILREAIDALGLLCQWTARLEQGKEWLEQHSEEWQRTVHEQEQVIQNLKGWIAELEKGKVWLDEQRVSWQRTAEERERSLQEQQERIGELERTNQWLDEQRRALQAETERWPLRWLTRVRSRLGSEKSSQLLSPRPAEETKDD